MDDRARHRRRPAPRTGGTRLSVVENVERERFPGRNGGTLMRGGPGRPKAREDVVKMLRSALFANGERDSMGILSVLIGRAMKGDMRAIELCLAYGIGKPTERVDIRLDVRSAAEQVAAETGASADWLLAEAERIAREYTAEPVG